MHTLWSATQDVLHRGIEIGVKAVVIVFFRVNHSKVAFSQFYALATQ